MNDMRNNGKGRTGKLARQFRAPRLDWDVPITTSATADPDTDDIATFEIPSIDKIVTRRLHSIDQSPTMQLQAFDMPSLSLSTELRAIRLALPAIPQEVAGDWADAATWVMPAIPKTGTGAIGVGVRSETKEKAKGAGSYISLALEMVKNSGIYAIAAMMSPLVSLILQPFLTHNLSPNDYGALANLFIIVDLISTVTQLGLSPAFFRAYNKDYETPRDRAGVLANTVLLLALFTIPAAIGMTFVSSTLSSVFLKSTE
jgi:hypothetical protein